jgi:leucyl-tRNA synthetase
MQYDFHAIETKWQAHWAQHKTFRAPNPGESDFDPQKPKYYVLDMFPYPSGVGLHVGHPLGYIATDIIARYKRMTGYNVLHPMGYDAFGLPAEQFAIETGVHPRQTTEKNIANMTRQLKRLGLSYDWDRELATTDVDYYKWTQWIFLQIFNSWFDPAANAARPIAELQQQLASGELDVGPDGELVPVGAEGGLDAFSGTPVGARKWHELDNRQRRAVIDSYRLAYVDEIPVNWCPALGTVLANEEVTNEGRSERGNHPVFKRPLKQWMLRITAYADRLIEDVDKVDWPEPIRQMQRNWIGRSVGAQVDFPIIDDPDETTIRVFTTRPDTLFGATYMVLAPEHELVTSVLIEDDETLCDAARDDNQRMSRQTIVTDECRAAVRDYIRAAQSRSDIDRMADTKEKSGVFTGAYATNPVNDEQIPIWIADYVLMGYGTGAIMAVPAHDDRDFAFAKSFKLPIRAVVMPSDAWLQQQAQQRDEQAGGTMPCAVEEMAKLRDEYRTVPAAFPEAFTGEGVNINSANDMVSINDQPTPKAKATILAYLNEQGIGKAQVQYKLRDWLFSRQRYWGEPFPILHGPDGEIVGVDEAELPVELPPMDDFRPKATDDPNAPPQPPLSRAPDSWKYVERDGIQYTREFNTMPQWAGSCWYYLRFIDPKNSEQLIGEDAERYWMVSRKTNGEPHTGGIDLYVGGAEHAVLHLLYARFWHKVLFDLGHVSTLEPFGRLFNQGYIQAHAYTDARGMYILADEVEEQDDQFFHNGEPVNREFGKMGKSLKNAVTPDDICEQYGCDTMRLYEMYLGPLDQSKVWRTRDIAGPYRFLQRLWRNFVNEDGKLLVHDDAPSEQLNRLLHKTVKRVTEDMERLQFNTAIAALIELNNELVALDTLPRVVAEAMTLMLAPFAPHVAEELWHRLGHGESIAREPWPEYDASLLVEDSVEYPIAINGKVRGRVTVPADADDDTIQSAAMADPKVQQLIEGKDVKKVIVVKGKMVNMVVK